MSIRLKFLKVAEAARRLSGPAFADIRCTVTIRKRTWSGYAPGDGTYVDEDLVLPPHYPVRPVNSQDVFGSAGRYEIGDISVNHITPSDGNGTGYTREQLKPTVTANNVEIIYVVRDMDGELEGEYRCIEYQQLRPFSARLILRRLASTP